MNLLRNVALSAYDIWGARAFTSRGRTTRKAWLAGLVLGSLVAFALLEAVRAGVGVEFRLRLPAQPSPHDWYETFAWWGLYELTHRAALWPLMVTGYIRRMHDANRTGRSVAWFAVPILWMVILPTLALWRRGDAGENPYSAEGDIEWRSAAEAPEPSGTRREGDIEASLNALSQSSALGEARAGGNAERSAP